MRKAVRIALVTSGVMLVLVVLVTLGIYWASQQVPSWYQEATATVEPEGQKQASDQMEQRLADLASGTQSTGEWEVLFTAEQINAWLASGLIRKHPDMLPPGFSDPRVVIEPDGITLGGRVQRGSTASIVSLKVDVSLSGPNVIAMRIRKARAGVLPWPLRDVLDAITLAARQLNVPIRWQQAQGDPVALVTLPAAEDRSVRIETLRLDEGKLYLAGVTEEAEWE